MFYKPSIFIFALTFSLTGFAQAAKDNQPQRDIESHMANSPKWTLQIVENETGGNAANDAVQSIETKIPSDVSVADNDDSQGPFIINGEDLDFILTLLEQLFQKPIIRAQGLPEKSLFNFRTKRKIPRDDAIVALRSLLMLNGVAIVPIDDKFLKAVPSANVSTQIPEFLDCAARELSPSQDFYTKFFELNNISVEDISGKLKTSQSGNAAGTIEIFPKSNAFLITDTLLNIQRIEELVERLDTPSEELFFLQVKNAPADEIKSRILAVKSDRLKNVKIETDARTNKLIILAPKPAKPLIENLVAELDTESEAVLKSEVVYIRHSESTKIAEILKQIASGQKSAKDKKTKTAAEPAQANAPQKPQDREISGEEEKNLSGGAEFSQYLQIVADERSNAVVIYGTPLDIKQAKGVIEKLDIVLLQVKIDVIITEVALSEGQVSGLSSFGISYGVDDAGFVGIRIPTR